MVPDWCTQLVVAFAMQADMRGLSYEEGVNAAEDIGRELEIAAEERAVIPGVRKESGE